MIYKFIWAIIHRVDKYRIKRLQNQNFDLRKKLIYEQGLVKSLRDAQDRIDSARERTGFPTTGGFEGDTDYFKHRASGVEGRRSIHDPKIKEVAFQRGIDGSESESNRDRSAGEGGRNSEV